MIAWLVDTHALLWFLNDDAGLSQTARETMESHDSRLLVSAASVWEMAIKAGQGKLDVPDAIPAVIEQQGFETLPVTAAHAWKVSELPVGDHKDPFDRQLVAQALVEDLPIISSDADFDRYGIRRHW